jgi:oxygen-independent coproporphyrinogen-3 oxidase
MKIDPQELLALSERYSTRVPRYTSYPTAVEFTPDFSSLMWRNALERDLTLCGARTSLYIHIPFCKKLCFFCACAREGGSNRSRVKPYMYSLMQELASYRDIANGMTISQLHFGGGSPNYLTPEELTTVVESVRAFFPAWDSKAELSIEFDPRETSIRHIQVARELGFSRISFGVQDFHPKVQKAIHRSQSLDATARLVSESRARGIEEINFDLIYGLPEQTLESWRKTLEQVINLQPNRLAVYGYAHVDWRAKNQQAFNETVYLPNAHERIALFCLTHSMLQDAGYYYLGMDHFAREDDSLTKAHRAGTMRRNFMGYSTQAGVRVIGLGASAISSTQYAYSQNHIPIQAYNNSMMLLGNAVARGMMIAPDDVIRRNIIEEIMCTGRVRLDDYAAKFTEHLSVAFPSLYESLEHLRADQLITIEDSVLTATPKGRFFLRNIASLFDGHLRKYGTTNKVFSSAV